MLKQGAQALIQDVRGQKTPLVFEVNFDDDFKDCVRIDADGQRFIVKYTDLFSFMFTIASKEHQAKMIPIREELGNQYMKQISVKLKKDMKEGEMMVVNVPINVPQVIEDAILKEKELLTVLP